MTKLLATFTFVTAISSSVAFADKCGGIFDRLSACGGNTSCATSVYNHTLSTSPGAAKAWSNWSSCMATYEDCHGTNPFTDKDGISHYLYNSCKTEARRRASESSCYFYVKSCQ